MVVLEILEIRRPEALDEGLFSYQPGNQEVIDYTDLYLQALKLAPPRRSQTGLRTTAARELTSSAGSSFFV